MPRFVQIGKDLYNHTIGLLEGCIRSGFARRLPLPNFKPWHDTFLNCEDYQRGYPL